MPVSTKFISYEMPVSTKYFPDDEETVLHAIPPNDRMPRKKIREYGVQIAPFLVKKEWERRWKKGKSAESAPSASEKGRGSANRFPLNSVSPKKAVKTFNFK